MLEPDDLSFGDGWVLESQEHGEYLYETDPPELYSQYDEDSFGFEDPLLSATPSTSAAELIPEHSIEQPYASNKNPKATIADCQICGMVLMHPSKILAHIRTHTGEQPFACEFCGQRFTQRTPWRMHVKKHLGDTPFMCSTCGRGFPSKGLRNAHELLHQGLRRRGAPRPHLKPQKLLVTYVEEPPIEPTEAVQMIAPDAPFAPAIPQKAMVELSHVEQSIPIQDEPCVTLESVAEIPEEQLQLPSFEKAATTTTCSFCGLALKYPSKIRAHMQIHLGIKEFSCDECGDLFSTRGSLNSHIRRKHNKAADVESSAIKTTQPLSPIVKIQLPKFKPAPPNIILLCSSYQPEMVSVVPDAPDLLYSCENFDSEAGPAHEANADFETKKPYRMIKRAPVTVHFCDICKKEFRYPSKIKEHLRIHSGERPFACEICPARFTQKHLLKSHSRMHNGERPYKCAYCARCFVSAQQHRMHEKGHLRGTGTMRASAICGNPSSSRQICHSSPGIKYLQSPERMVTVAENSAWQSYDQADRLLFEVAEEIVIVDDDPFEEPAIHVPAHFLDHDYVDKCEVAEASAISPDPGEKLETEILTDGKLYRAPIQRKIKIISIGLLKPWLVGYSIVNVANGSNTHPEYRNISECTVEKSHTNASYAVPNSAASLPLIPIGIRILMK
ncbi:unnamed protein product, partial [Mesorhabditis spiculigera]